jgi:hypothetical protein
MKDQRSYRIWAFAIPLVCLVLGVILIMTQLARVRGLDAEKAQISKNISFVQGLIAQNDMQPLADKEPAIPQTADEQSLFLNELRLHAANARIELVRWANSPPPAQQPGAPAPPPSGPTIPIVSSVETAGTYQNLRAFMYSLLRSPRLLNVSNLTWRREDDYPNTRLIFTLTRYVTKPQPIANVQPTSTAGATNPSGGTP